ncbi:YraN family protein [Actinokineospora soli]
MSDHISFGTAGEALAARHLEHLGMRLLSRNWRCALGELDIIATDGRELVICEVKTRRSTTHGTPAESVTPAKADRIRALATRWRHDHGIPPCPTRFDIIAILWPTGTPPVVHHLTGAF